MRGPQNSCRTQPQPKNSPLGNPNPKNNPLGPQKSKMTPKLSQNQISDFKETKNMKVV